jgi:hypothetical protein
MRSRGYRLTLHQLTTKFGGRQASCRDKSLAQTNSILTSPQKLETWSVQQMPFSAHELI